MDSHLSLIGSIVIGGLLLLGILRYQSDLKEHSFKQTNNLSIQYNAMGIIEVLEQDFRNIGFGVSDSAAFAVADSDSIKYYVDLGADGITDSVRYFVSATSAASGTPNPRDRILYRIENDAPQVDAALGVTDFKLKYFDDSGIETTDLSEIKTIEITLEMESPIPYDGEVGSFFWRKKITPPSLLF